MRSLQNREKKFCQYLLKILKRKQLKDLIPGLTDFRIKEATAVPTAPVHRFFLSEDNVDHFLRFITSDMISQDTAYGTSKMKLESGVELVIPKPIRKLIPARIIAQYLTICDESRFKPACTRILFRILEVCPASTRKSLQGLDNYTADGSEAFVFQGSLLVIVIMIDGSKKCNHEGSF